MNPRRFGEITSNYRELKLAVVGDFCLDRYLEIDPEKKEISLETGLPVHNVVNVRSQPGGAGTIVNNLAALGLKAIFPIAFGGDDGEGLELRRALEKLPGVLLNYFALTELRRTFTYTKPLLISLGQPPIELNRLDFKNWTPTPAKLQTELVNHLLHCTKEAKVNAIIALEQTTLPETGMVTRTLVRALTELAEKDSSFLILADSRRGLRNFPKLSLKMNAVELMASTGQTAEPTLDQIKQAALTLARQQERAVFVTLAERGMLGATAVGQVEHVPALPVRGPIDIVGAGDTVSANLVVALCAGASLHEALELASAAASVVIHKLGTTGTASIAEVEQLVAGGRISEVTPR